MKAQPVESPRRLLVGLGNLYRGDDAVGPLVVSEAARQLRDATPNVHVVDRAEPASLLHLLEGVETAVVVDAVRTGRRPGDVVVIDIGLAAAANADLGRLWPGLEGTHGLGLAAVVELARTLQLLPAHLVVVGIEAENFETGSALSAAVSSAVSVAADAVLEVLGASNNDRRRIRDGAAESARSRP